MLLAFLQSVVLTGATVHGLAGGAPPAARDVLVQKGRIVSVAEPGKLAAPADAKRVDLAGLHLVPGLIDALVNHDPDQDRLYVANGVTLVRDQGSDLSPALAERETSARERGPGPAILTAGAPLVGDANLRTGIVLGSASEAEEKLARLLAESKLDYLSIAPSLASETWKKVIEVAHEKGLAVWGPAIAGTTSKEAIAAGQDGLFFVDALLPQGKAWNDATLDELTPRIDELAASRTAIVPGLALHASHLTHLKESPENAPELRLLGPLYTKQWIGDAIQRGRLFGEEKQGPGRLRAALQAFELQQACVKRLFEKHATIVPGSASPNPWLLPGRALVEELVLWGRAGVPPADVVRAATIGAAKALGVEKERGSIEPGKVADLVAYAADPETDLATLRDPRFVVLRGRVLDRATLDGLLDDLKTRQVAVQKRVFNSEPLAIADVTLPPGDVVLVGSAEQRVLGMRLSVEKYAVARSKDGAYTYRVHMVTLGGISTSDTDVVLSQTIRDGRLSEFELVVQAGARKVETKGTLTGNVLNVERRVDGQFLSNVPVRDKLVLVDVGSILTPILVAQHAREGPFKALFFEDFEPAYGPWELKIDANGTLLVKTHSGFATARFADTGLPRELKREQGRGIVEWTILSGDARGPGLPIPAANKVPSKPGDAPAQGSSPR